MNYVTFNGAHSLTVRETRPVLRDEQLNGLVRDRKAATKSAPFLTRLSDVGSLSKRRRIFRSERREGSALSEIAEEATLEGLPPHRDGSPQSGAVNSKALQIASRGLGE